jgi:thiol:disulfide interchange protein
MIRIRTVVAVASFSIALIVLAPGLGCDASSEPEPSAGTTDRVEPAAHSAVFADLSYEQALQQADESGKLLIVDFTAVWCKPCKQMEQTTWVDPTVVAWAEEHAVAVKVDIDKRGDLARQFGVRGIPVVMLMRDGQEIDRVVGYRGAEELLGWLSAATDASDSPPAAG